ncbi:Uracil-DNA glycosylase-like protein [Gracilaria domingensis]|nr:Uracil-DNA glycosylase-like protein [Gracilaria domingensis]
MIPNQMSTTPIDALRSTRTRIAKIRQHTQLTPSRPTPCDNADNDVKKRDFSRYFGEKHPLRIVFVGHNPSAKSWDEVAPYAHRTNQFWRLLQESQLAPAHLCKPSQHAKLPGCCGIGFIDLFVTSGSDASKIGKRAVRNTEWKQGFFERLECGTGGTPPRILCCVSKIVARKLLGGWNGEFGHVGSGRDWNLRGAETSEVWILPSTSGRAGLTFQARLEPFQKLATRCSTLDNWIDPAASNE